MKIKKESKLFITNGLTLYIGSIIDTIPHKHNAMQITFPVEGDFTIEIEHKMIQTKSMIIRSKCSHRLVGKNGIQMFIFVEPESVYSDALKAFLGDMSYKEIPIDQSLIETLESEIMNHKSITKVLERILSSLQLQIDIESSMDERIKRVLEKIETIHEKKILIQNLANHVSLS
ncbi:MAG TPA: hypothetical protein PLP72_24385, partial [Leptospiraceae bacterium]|nr:hypothetical protein [Leptospiraceae bacterium]